jgi:hypothetical protein
MLRSLLTAVLLSIVLACRSAAPEGDGTIAVAWTGESNGNFSATAEGRWCASDTLLEVIAVRNDTAVGFTLIAQDSPRAARYPVNETRSWTPGRPQGNIGLRWLAPLELKGYEGIGGNVMVSAGDSATVTGTFDVQLRPLTGRDTLRLTGRFTRIGFAPAVGPCGRANRPGQG